MAQTQPAVTVSISHVAPASPRPLVPPMGTLDRLPRFLWWVAWPTGAGWMWLLLGAFLIVPEYLRNFNLVMLVASFMLALWGVSLLFSHMRSLLCMWLMLMCFALLAIPAALGLMSWPLAAGLAVPVLIGFFTWSQVRASLRKLQARRTVEQLPVAGESFLVQLELQNPAATNQRGIRVIDHGRCHYHRWGIPALPPGDKAVTKYEVFLPRRGRYVWGPLEISSAYPFGLFRKRLYLPTTDTTIVLPRQGKLHEGRLRRLLQGPTRATPPLRHRHSRRTLAPADFCGVREFRSGDSPRLIHWRTTARVGYPMVREFEEPPLEHLLVVLDPWLPAPILELLQRWQQVRKENVEIQRMVDASSQRVDRKLQRAQMERLATTEAPLRLPLDNLERAVSLAATLSWQWGQQGGAKVYLGIAEAPLQILERKEAGSRGALALLERLATVVGGPDIEAAGLCKALEEAEIPNCPLVVVSTRADSPVAGALGRVMRRPVNVLDVTSATVNDLFTTDASAEMLL